MFHLLGISILNQSIQKTGFPVTNLPLKILIWHCPSFELKQKFWSFSTKGNFTSSAIKFSFTPDRASNWVSVSVCVYVLKVYVHCVCVCVCVRERERAKGRERGEREQRECPSMCIHAGLFQQHYVCLNQFRIYFLAHWVCLKLLWSLIVYVWVFVRASTHVWYCPNSPFP